MSDLAPFVAAVLRDKTVVDLKEENDNLQSENDNLQSKLDSALSRMIRITGPGGSPVYAERSYLERHRPILATGWKLHLINCTASQTGDVNLPPNPCLAMCNVEDIMDCELHIGTKAIVKLSSCQGVSSVLYPEGEGMPVYCCVNFPWGPSERHCQPSVYFGFDGPAVDPKAADYPNGWFPEYYRNEQVEWVRFNSVLFFNDPFEVDD